MSGTPIEARFWAKVSKGKTSECWEWAAGRNEFGYGLFFLNGRRERAHRVSHSLFVGPIPEGMVVRHKCDNPPCINPDHLEVGTQGDNMQDAWTRGRRTPWSVLVTACCNGHEYTPANTRHYRGRRHCRACDKQRKALSRRIAA